MSLLSLVQGFGVHHALNPDPYRGPFGADGKLYANDLANLLESATPGRIAGFFHETIQVFTYPFLFSYAFFVRSFVLFKDVDQFSYTC
jgi:hypothetical protein